MVIQNRTVTATQTVRIGNYSIGQSCLVLIHKSNPTGSVMFCISIDGRDVWDAARGGWVEQFDESTIHTVEQICFKDSLDGFDEAVFKKIAASVRPSIIVFQNLESLDSIKEKRPNGSTKYTSFEGFLRNLLRAIHNVPSWEDIHTLHFINCECFMQTTSGLERLLMHVPMSIHTLKVSGTTGLYMSADDECHFNFDTIDLSDMSLSQLVEMDTFIYGYLRCTMYQHGIHWFRTTRPKIILPPALDMTPLDTLGDIAATADWFGALFSPITFGKCRNEGAWDEEMKEVMDTAFFGELEHMGIYTGGMRVLIDRMFASIPNVFRSSHPARYETTIFALFYARVFYRVETEGIEFSQAILQEFEQKLTPAFRLFENCTDSVVAYVYAHAILNKEVEEDEDGEFEMDFSEVANFLLPTWTDAHEKMCGPVFTLMSGKYAYLMYNYTNAHEFYRVETNVVGWICSPAIELVNAPLHIAEIRNGIRDLYDWDRIGRTLDVMIAKKEVGVRTDSDILHLNALTIVRNWKNL